MLKKTELEESQSQMKQQPIASENVSPEPQSRKEQVMIGKTIHIKGDLVGEEDLLIEGYVDGKVQLPQHKVTVGKTGHVNADIYGNEIIIEGDVEGNLFGEDQLILKKSCKVRGNITAPRVVLEDGSNFKGNVDMNPEEESTKSSPILNPSLERQFDQEAMTTVNTTPAMDIAEM
jgi:cytoskeletal protein CcmA (bactofilin family)